jgi:cytochrome c oxidase assembly protein subunit 15
MSIRKPAYHFVMTPAPNPTLRRLATASIVTNIAIVVTGGAVRLTDSGLGCPTWPRCTSNSLVPTARLGYHSAIEFGNRMLTYVLAVVAVATMVAAYRARPVRADVRRLALLLFVGIPAQAVLGGITVLTDLNPWVVMFHLLISMDLVALATLLRRRLDEGDGPPVHLVGLLERRLGLAVLGLTGAVMYLGTIVTGSGPHAGDAQARRTGLDPRVLSLTHGWFVTVLVAATVVLWLRTSGEIRRAVALVLGVQLAQGLMGWAQYATGLPRLVVALHMLGAGLLVVATVRMVLSLRSRPSRQDASPVASNDVSRALPIAGRARDTAEDAVPGAVHS